MKETENELLTPEEASELLKVSKRTMYEWLRNGVFPSERIGDRLIRVRRTNILSPDAKAYFEQGCQLAQDISTLYEAINSFKKAIDINPQYGLAYSTLGQSLMSYGRSIQALEVLKKAVELNSNFSNYVYLGRCCFQLRRYHEAENAFCHALEVQTDSFEKEYKAEILFEYGFAIYMQAFYKNERLKEAMTLFRKSLDISPYYKSAHFLSKILIWRLGEYDKALLLADEIQEFFPLESEEIRNQISIIRK